MMRKRRDWSDMAFSSAYSRIRANSVGTAVTPVIRSAFSASTKCAGVKRATSSALAPAQKAVISTVPSPIA
jgi:hypothetical protein